MDGDWLEWRSKQIQRMRLIHQIQQTKYKREIPETPLLSQTPTNFLKRPAIKTEHSKLPIVSLTPSTSQSDRFEEELILSQDLEQLIGNAEESPQQSYNLETNHNASTISWESNIEEKISVDCSDDGLSQVIDVEESHATETNHDDLQPERKRKRVEKAPQKRRWKIHPTNEDWATTGYYNTVFKKLKEQNDDEFFEYTRMNLTLFTKLHNLIGSKLRKAKQRIRSEERLSITLLYLTQGDNLDNLAKSYKLGKSTIREIILQTCETLWTTLAPEYVKTPTEEDYTENANEFLLLCGVPNCLGVLDWKLMNYRNSHINKHIQKKLVLIAICDATYNFSAVDICNYSESDTDIFESIPHCQAILKKELPLPPDRPLPNTTDEFPHYFIGSKSFPFLSNIMLKYSGDNLTTNQRNFNIRLSRVHSIIENSFGVLTARWKILRAVLDWSQPNCKTIILACFALHNFLMQSDHDGIYCPEHFIDTEVVNNGKRLGQWRMELAPLGGSLPSLQCESNFYDYEAIQLRDMLAEHLPAGGTITKTRLMKKPKTMAQNDCNDSETDSIEARRNHQKMVNRVRKQRWRAKNLGESRKTSHKFERVLENQPIIKLKRLPLKNFTSVDIPKIQTFSHTTQGDDFEPCLSPAVKVESSVQSKRVIDENCSGAFCPKVYRVKNSPDLRVPGRFQQSPERTNLLNSNYSKIQALPKRQTKTNVPERPTVSKYQDRNVIDREKFENWRAEQLEQVLRKHGVEDLESIKLVRSTPLGIPCSKKKVIVQNHSKHFANMVGEVDRIRKEDKDLEYFNADDGNKLDLNSDVDELEADNKWTQNFELDEPDVAFDLQKNPIVQTTVSKTQLSFNRKHNNNNFMLDEQEITCYGSSQLPDNANDEDPLLEVDSDPELEPNIKELFSQKTKEKQRIRRWNIRPGNDRTKSGFHKTEFLSKKLQNEDDLLFYTRMKKRLFSQLEKKITSHVKKPKQQVGVEERLYITLRYLALGEPIGNIADSHHIGKSTARGIMFETCQALWESLSPDYMQSLSQEQYLENADDFSTLWDVPNCVGSMEWKEIVIGLQPANTKCRKINNTCSIILAAICDARYHFTAAHVCTEWENDFDLYRSIPFGDAHLRHQLPLPPPRPLPNTTENFPHFFVGSASFPFRPDLMRQFPGNELNRSQQIYNYRLSRVRRIIENSFGVLVARWKILRTNLDWSPENCKTIILACMILHNFLMRHDFIRYCPEDFVDRELPKCKKLPGLWRKELDPLGGPLPSLRTPSRRGSEEAAQLRNKLCEYFISEGQIPFQDLKVRSDVTSTEQA